MSDEDWKQEYARCLGVYLAGDVIVQTDLYGRPVSDSRFLVLFNAHHEDIVFRLPEVATATRWMVLMDTTHEDGLGRAGVFNAGSDYLLHSRSVALLQEQKAAR